MQHPSPAPGVVEENCLLCQHDGQQIKIVLDTPAWRNWLDSATSFAFKSAEGNFTAHKTNTLYEGLGKRFESRAEIPQMPLLVLCFSMMRHASILYEWNRLSEAARLMQDVLKMLPQAFHSIVPNSSQPSLHAFGLWAQARIAWAQGQPEAAHAFLELVRDQLDTPDGLPPYKERPPVDASMLATHLTLLCGRTEETSQWENTCGMHFDDIPGTLLDNTVKRHVKNILARLDATNRTQAVARARELNLL